MLETVNIPGTVIIIFALLSVILGACVGAGIVFIIMWASKGGI